MRVRSMSRMANSVSADDQRAGNVVEAQHHRRAVGAGAAPAAAGPPGQHEAGAGVGLVDDVGGQRRQAVALGGQRGAHAGVGTARRRRRAAAAALELAGTTCAVRQVFGQPVPHLRRGHREGGDRRDFGGRRARVAPRCVNATSRVSSAKICSGVPIARLSSVGSTEPSIEFSIGTHA